MKLSVMTLPLLPMPEIPGLDQARQTRERPSLRSIYGQIQAAGITDLDISSMDFQYGGEAAVLEALNGLGMRCSCYLAFISAPTPTAAENQRAVEQGKEAVEQALRLGTRVMMFVPAGNQAAVEVFSRQQLADEFAAVLRPVAEYAAEKGVTVVIEDAPHREFPMCSEAELRYLLESVPGLKQVYDSGNMLFAGEDPVEYYDHLRTYMAHGHLKDIARQEDGALTECRHGEGIVDFPALLAHLKRDGYDGYLAIELAPNFETEESITERVKHAVGYFKALL